MFGVLSSNTEVLQSQISNCKILLCICLIMIIVLVWYIKKQNYVKARDRYMFTLHYLDHMRRGDLEQTRNDTKTCGLMTQVYEKDKSEGYYDIPTKEGYQGTMAEDAWDKHQIPPEVKVMNKHKMGTTIVYQKMEDPLVTDGLLVKSNEPKTEALMRSLTTADYDAPQQEGMSAPIEEMERRAMEYQQDSFKGDPAELIHGSAGSTAKALSESGM